MKTKTLKLTGLLITMMILIATLGMFSITSSAADDLTVDITGADGNPASVTLKDADGDGYYEIGTADELYAFAAAVNGGNYSINGELTADIVVNENVLDEDGALNGDGSDFRVWTPIGNSNNQYEGSFDGAEHTVSGLYFNDTEQNYVGLFGFISGATVKNVGVVDSYFNADFYVGGVIGHTYSGTVTNCYNTGAVNGKSNVGGVVGENNSTITNCYNTGTVSGTRYYVGGVVGSTGRNSTITNCYNTGPVNGGNCVGGVAGDNYYDSTITNCYYLAGSATTGIGNGESAGIKEVTEAQVKAASGEEDALVDMLNEWVSEQADAKYTGWHICPNVSSDHPSLNLACTYSDNGENHVVECALCGNETEEAHVGGTATCIEPAVCERCGESYGETDKTNHEKDIFTNGFRDCCGEYQPAILNAEGVYEIESAGQLYWFAQQVGGGNTSINGKLTANITVNENVLTEDGALNGDGSNFRAWTPIGKSNNRYIGIFDGAEHTVSGLYFNDTNKDYVGLFGYISGATVKNVGVVDSYFNAKDYVGGVVGDSYQGTITNCYNTGSVNGESGVGGVVGHSDRGTITNCYNTGTVSGAVYSVGGVVGHNRGSIAECYNTGTVTGAESVGGVVGGTESVGGVVGGTDQDAIMNCHNAGGVSGVEQVGGVVGRNHHSTITNCYNAGTVTGTENVGGVAGENDEGRIKYCYNAGTVTGTEGVGGVVGYNNNNNNNNSTITNCYNTGAVNGGNYVGGVAGETDEGTITNCYNTGTVSGNYVGGVVGQTGKCTITNCYNTGPVNGEYYVGGVVGENNNSTITNCYNAGTVTGTEGVGGVAGLNFFDITITNCYNAGTVTGTEGVGGVAGLNFSDSTITNCYNAGTVTGTEGVGGVVGENNNGNSTITNCYNTGTVTGTGDYVGGVVGENNNSTITNCYYLEGTATGGINGADEDGKAVAKTAAQFASGEVAYLLQMAQAEQVWGQTLAGEGKDAYPVLGGKVVYFGYLSCAADAEMVYTNDEAASDERLDHDMAEATCTVPSTCKREDCGHTEGTVNENAHVWNEGAVTTNPTCTAKGVKTYTCMHNSAHTYTEDVAIDANAHVYDNACDSECNACGEERTPAEHVDADENNACDECGEKFELSGGAIAGIVSGSVAVLGGGGFALWWFVFRKKRRI